MIADFRFLIFELGQKHATPKRRGAGWRGSRKAGAKDTLTELKLNALPVRSGLFCGAEKGK